MTRREAGALAALVLARVALAAARFAAEPARFANVEESWNASVAWLLGRAPVADWLPALQYRSFCGGCTAVSVAGAAPLFAAGDHAWAWKLVPILWAAAMHVVGFAAVDRALGRPAAWAWAVLWAAPPVAMLDLSLMAWGNHQESGLFVLAALGVAAAGRPFALGLVLGLGTWFARTSVYAVAALVPWALWRGPGRARLLLGLALGLAPLAIPAAGGDAGWYRLYDPVGASPGGLDRRVAALLGPEALGARLFLPDLALAPAAAAWLIVGLGGAALAASTGRAAPLALQAAWTTAWLATSFPIFLINARVPVNNVRYHGPWFLLLALGAAAGVGALWGRGRRALAVAALAALLGPAAASLVRAGWRPDPGAAAAPIVDLASMTPMLVPRLDTAALHRRARPGADAARVDAWLARLDGLRLGHGGDVAQAVAAAGGDVHRLAGAGEALVEPCTPLDAAAARVGSAPDDAQAALARGAALTLGFCPERRGWPPEAWLARAAPAFSSAAGAAAWERCARAADGGSCLATALGALPEAVRAEAAFGAGRAWADPRRLPAETGATAATLGPLAAAFTAGATDPAAGSRMPAWGRAVPR